MTEKAYTIEEGKILDRTIELGELIYLLKRAHSDAPVYFDFCECIPYALDSYRGYYDQLALSWRPPGHSRPTVGELLQIAEGAVGKDYQGYKGGYFKMGPNTPVWVDNYGKCTHTGIVGYRRDGSSPDSPVMLLTAYTEAFI